MATNPETAAPAFNTKLWLHLLIIPALDFGYLALIFGWLGEDPLTRLAISAWTGYFLLCLGSCFHETAHLTLSRKRWFDVGLGEMIGTVMFTPYTVYRESHIRHHAYLNKPADFELWPYSDPTKSRGFRMAFAWFDLLAGAVAAPIIYGRIYFDEKSPITDPAVRRTIRKEYIAGGLMGAFWVAAGAVGLKQGWLDVERILWLCLPATIYGALQTARKFTEHLGMQSYDPLVGTRTVVGKGLLTRLAAFVNFDIIVHGPHHRYPKASHESLEDKMAQNQAANPQVAYPVFPSYLSAMRAMLPCLLTNPGVGMNVGAAAPDKGGVADGRELVDGENVETLAVSEIRERTAA